jgi:hypothetical protein
MPLTLIRKSQPFLSFCLLPSTGRLAAASALQGLIDANYERAVRSKCCHKEANEDLAGLPTRPSTTVQHPMSGLDGGELTQAQDTLDRGDGALAWSQNGARHEEQDMPPHASGEETCTTDAQRYDSTRWEIA